MTTNPANAQSATNAAQQFAAAQALQQAYSAYTFAAQTLPVHQSLSNPSHHHHQQQQLPQSGAEAALKNEELQPPQQSQPLNFWGPQQWQEAYWPRGTFLPGAAPTPEIGLPQSMALGAATSALPQLASSHCASSITQPPQFFQPIGYNYNNSVSAASSTAAQQWLLCGGAKREAAELLESEEKASGAGTGADNNCQLPTDVHQHPTLNFPYRQHLPRRQFGPGTNNLRVRTKDQYRIVYTEYQRLELEREFHQQQFINTQRKAELSSRLHLTERQIKIWFQNRRAKERRMNKRLTEPNYSTQQIRSNTF